MRPREAEGVRRDGLDGLRALAALGVFVGHVFTLSLLENLTVEFSTAKNRLLIGGGMGVFLFFTLSGYLLFRPFLRAMTSGRAVSLGSYARNRALRILPLYVVVVAVVLLAVPFDVHRDQWWRYALFIENYSPHTATFPDSPIWSLQVEVQFYVALPLLAWVLARVSGGRRRRVAIALLALGWFSYALRRNGIDAHDALGVWQGKYSLPTLTYLFVSGMLVATLEESMRARPRRWQDRALLGSSTAWVAAGLVVFVFITLNYSLQEPTVALGGFLLVGGVVLPLRPGPLRSALAWKPLVTVGIASYSLYLWHVPVIELITGNHPAVRGGALVVAGHVHDFKLLLIGCLPVVALVTALSYRFIEVPMLARRRRWAAADTREAAPGDVAVPALAARSSSVAS